MHYGTKLRGQKDTMREIDVERYCTNCGKLLSSEFNYCPFCGINLTNFSKDETSNKFFDIRDGVLVKYTGRASNIVIPNEVTKIGKYAFVEERTGYRGRIEYVPNEYVKSIHIPNSVKEIKPYAFALCVNLTDVNLPASLKEIEEGVFSGCRELTNVYIPDSVIYIGHHAFGGVGGSDYCKKLTATIPESVVEIADDLYSYMYNEDSDHEDVVYGGMVFLSGRGYPVTKCKLNSKYEAKLRWVQKGKCRHCGGEFSFWNCICKNCGKKRDYTPLKK